MQTITANAVLEVGDVLYATESFTTPHGAWFRAGSAFRVSSVGTVNAKLRSCGPDQTVVWFDIAEGVFVAELGYPAEAERMA